MSQPTAPTKLAEVLRPVSRPEPVLPIRQYEILGAKWYARGLYIKETKQGSEIQARLLYRVEQGDFVYNRLFAWKGSFALASERDHGCHVSNEFPCFEIDDSRLDPKYISYYFSRSQSWNEALDLSSGSTPTSRNRLKEAKFLAMELQLPALPEQRRLVARIETLAEQLHEASSLRRMAIQDTESIWTNSLRCAFADFKDQEVPLEDACSAIIDNLHSNPRYSYSGIPCVRSPDVGWGTLSLETALRTDEVEYHRRTVRGEPQADDIVLVREGGGTGKAAMVADGQRFSLGQRVMMLRPNKEMVLPKFFLYQLLSPLIQDDHIAPVSKGSAAPHLNIGSLRKFPFRLPSLADQRRIVAELNELEAEVKALRHLQTETTTELDALLPSVLARAFAGDL